MNKQQLINELKSEGFSDLILNAFEKVKRERFIPDNLKEYAYEDQPLPIAPLSTISQPYTIAFMLNLLELDRLIDNNKLVTNKSYKPDGSSEYEKSSLSKGKKFDIISTIAEKNKIKILEIGSGSGYVLALISEIMKISKIRDYEVYGIERIKKLADSSKKILKGNKKIIVINKDGSKGLLEKSPFDIIIVSASFDKIPENLFGQLKEGGILVTPVKNSIFQFKKINNNIKIWEFPGFVFVPVINENI